MKPAARRCEVMRGTRIAGARTRGMWWVQGTGRYEGPGTF